MAEEKDAGSPSGNGASGDEAGKLEARINETVNKALGARLGRLKDDLTETIKQLVTAHGTEGKAHGGDDAPAEKTNLKSLTAEMETLKRQLANEKQAAADARDRAEVNQRIAARLGADNPHVPLVMDSLYDVRKRFVRQSDGRLAVKFTEGGFEDLKPLDEGVEALFTGELKHLIPSKTKDLPAANRGIPFTRQNGNAAPTPLEQYAAQAAGKIARAGIKGE